MPIEVLIRSFVRNFILDVAIAAEVGRKIRGNFR
jgi:hypothetical protein